jgi:hypothetical protein
MCTCVSEIDEQGKCLDCGEVQESAWGRQHPIKYEYLLHTWGGFYNDQFQKLHKHNPGYYFFDTKEEREDYLGRLKEVEHRLGARRLMYSTYEGHHLRGGEIVAHRICRYKGKTSHTTREFPPGYLYDDIVDFMRHRWYPGFNDYPFGDDFDYCKNEVTVVQEWVTGSFCNKCLK